VVDKEHFDFVIVGGGSAGCVLANRLSRNPATRVLLLEAGPKDANIWLKVPAGIARVVSHPTLTWGYMTEEEPGLNNRRISWPRGKTLGGSSSINGHVYMRGMPADYDGWRALGNEGWGWEDVLPHFRRTECHYKGANALHGGEGELHVSPLYDPHPASTAFVDAAVEAGLPRNDDFNGSRQEGVGYLEFMIHNGARASASAAFLKPVLGRKNLVVRVGALVERVIVEGKRATGVRYTIGGQVKETLAGEVILSGGAINSPQILMLSGIGPAEHLVSHGIHVAHHLPGVGQNLQDHPYGHCVAKVDPSFSINARIASNWRMLPEIMRYVTSRRGLLTSAAAQVGAFFRSRPDITEPDIQIQMRPFSMISKGKMFAVDTLPTLTASCGLLRPYSTGSITLRSANPCDMPRMVANYFSDERDLQPMVEAIRLIRRIFVTSPFLEHYEGEVLPGDEYRTDMELRTYLRENGQSMYHPVGTCRMGRGSDAVVDQRLRVHGIEGLRVVDASVMPKIVSGNTNAPTIMIADKAADMILEDRIASTPHVEARAPVVVK
jgi:choline dehydrogenase